MIKLKQGSKVNLGSGRYLDPVHAHADTKKMTPYTLSKNRIFSSVTLTLYLGVQEVKMGLIESLTPINGCHDTYIPISCRVSFDSPDSSNDLENTSFMGVMTPFYGCQVLI